MCFSSALFLPGFSFLISVPGSSGSPTERGVSRSVMKRPIAPANEIAAGIQKHHFHAPTWLGPLPRVPMI